MTIDYLEYALPLAEHQYAVIDRMQVPVLPAEWPVIELVSPMLAPQAHLYPWLVPLHELPADAWRKLMAELAQHTDPCSPPVCSLMLSSSAPVQAVRNALVGALYFKDEQQKGYILRYYDPRVLFHLHWMLSPWQLFNQLVAREIPRWTFWLEGSWHTLVFPERLTYQPNSAVGMPLAQLQRCGQINQALLTLPRSTDLQQRQSTSRRIDALLEQAIKCELPTQEDRIAFALQGLTQREGFWATPKMQAFLAQAKQTADFYRDETSDWDDSRWLEMTQIQARNTGWSL